MTRVPALLVAGALALLAGCSGGSAAPDAAGPPGGGSTAAAPGTPGAAGAGVVSPAPPGSPVACPPPPPGGFPWPAGVPTDLPQPPGAVLTSAEPGQGGLTVVRFTTAQSLREGVLHLVRALAPAGYTLGRGDAEAAEADAPFTRDGLRGIYRMVAREPCATDWLLAVAPQTPDAAPLLPPSTGSAPPSPLPLSSPLPFG